MRRAPQGAVFFWLLFFCARKKKVTRREAKTCPEGERSRAAWPLKTFSVKQPAWRAKKNVFKKSPGRRPLKTLSVKETPPGGQNLWTTLHLLFDFPSGLQAPQKGVCEFAHDHKNPKSL